MADRITIKLLPSQQEFLRHDEDPLFGFLAGVGTGKSFACALWCLQRAMKGENVFVGSQTFTTTYDVQIKAIKDACSLIGIPYVENKSDPSLTFSNGAVIRGTSSASANSVTGATNFHCAWFDEAFLWDENARLFVEGRLRGLNPDGSLIKPKIRYTGTGPLEASGWWYKFLKSSPNLYVRAATTEAVGKTLSEEFYQSQVKAYGGEQSPLCRIQIFGELPVEGGSSCVFSCETEPIEIPVSLGIDCAGSGRDEDYFTVTNGLSILEEYHSDSMTTQERVAKAVELIERHNVKRCNIDATGGFGNGLVDLLKAKYDFVNGINFGQSAVDKVTYGNARAEMYSFLAKHWNFGDLYREERFATVYTVNASGKLMLAPKESIKAIIGKSPDGLDSLALAMYESQATPIAKPCTAEELNDILDICSFLT